jgi:hypothetical protein
MKPKFIHLSCDLPESFKVGQPLPDERWLVVQRRAIRLGRILKIKRWNQVNGDL